MKNNYSLLFLFLILQTLCIAQTEKAFQLYQKGADLLFEQKYEEARDAYTEAIENYKQYYDA